MHFDLPFAAWFSGSKVVDGCGYPLIVYRGEHGPPKRGARFQTRLGSISFASERVARYYSQNCNNKHDVIDSPRVLPTYLSIRRPVIDRPRDPFIEFGEIQNALGCKKACQIALRLSSHVENTSNWIDNFGLDYESVQDFLWSREGALSDLYVDAYAVFDDREFVSWFCKAGYDGAIHGGCGYSFGETEYKIFNEFQSMEAYDFEEYIEL